MHHTAKKKKKVRIYGILEVVLQYPNAVSAERWYCTGSESRRAAFKSCLCYILSLRLWASSSASLYLSFLNCKMGIMRDPPLRVVRRIKYINSCKGLIVALAILLLAKINTQSMSVTTISKDNYYK